MGDDKVSQQSVRLKSKINEIKNISVSAWYFLEIWMFNGPILKVTTFLLRFWIILQQSHQAYDFKTSPMLIPCRCCRMMRFLRRLGKGPWTWCTPWVCWRVPSASVRHFLQIFGLDNPTFFRGIGWEILTNKKSCTFNTVKIPWVCGWKRDMLCWIYVGLVHVSRC